MNFKFQNPGREIVEHTENVRVDLIVLHLILIRSFISY